MNIKQWIKERAHYHGIGTVVIADERKLAQIEEAYFAVVRHDGHSGGDFHHRVLVAYDDGWASDDEIVDALERILEHVKRSFKK